MTTKYTPISQRENIENKDVAKILDYLERHAKSFEEITRHDGYRIDKFNLHIINEHSFIVDDVCTIVVHMPTKILSGCIAYIYQELKHYK